MSGSATTAFYSLSSYPSYWFCWGTSLQWETLDDICLQRLPGSTLYIVERCIFFIILAKSTQIASTNTSMWNSIGDRNVTICLICLTSFSCHCCFRWQPCRLGAACSVHPRKVDSPQGLRRELQTPALRSGVLFPKPRCIRGWRVFTFLWPCSTGIAVWYLPSVQFCYGVTATSSFHSVHYPGMPLPFILFINKKKTYIIYSNSGNCSLLALCLGQLWKCNTGASVCFVRNLHVFSELR